MAWKLFKITRHTSFAALPSLVQGALMFITDENRLCVHNGSAWERILALPAANWDTNVLKSIGKAAYPVGSYYIQYPDASSNTDSTEFPTSQRPATLFGGTWSEQWATESVYFRTRGTLSDDGRTNGKQEDQIQTIAGKVTGQSSQNIMGVGGSGIFRNADSTEVFSGTGSALTLPRSAEISAASLTAAGVRNGNETRTVNRRIKVWKRTA